MKFLLSIIFEYYDTANFDKWEDFLKVAMRFMLTV